jgi:hypothetical protein
VQAFVDEQDTLRSTVAPAPAGLGVGRIDHRLPFHCSARGRESEPPYGSFVQLPTAMHDLCVGQDTASSELPVAPGGLGDGSTTQGAAPAPGAAPAQIPIATTNATGPRRTLMTESKLDPPAAFNATSRQLSRASTWVPTVRDIALSRTERNAMTLRPTRTRCRQHCQPGGANRRQDHRHTNHGPSLRTMSRRARSHDTLTATGKELCRRGTTGPGSSPARNAGTTAASTLPMQEDGYRTRTRSRALGDLRACRWEDDVGGSIGAP